MKIYPLGGYNDSVFWHEQYISEYAYQRLVNIAMTYRYMCVTNTAYTLVYTFFTKNNNLKSWVILSGLGCKMLSLDLLSQGSGNVCPDPGKYV